MKLIGVLLMVGGIVLGIWLGVFVMFIGGIIQILNGLPHQTLGGIVPLNAVAIAIGIAKILFSGAAGWLVGICMTGLGAVLASD